MGTAGDIKMVSAAAAAAGDGVNTVHWNTIDNREKTQHRGTQLTMEQNTIDEGAEHITAEHD